MRIVFDLDGVFRDLCGYLHHKFSVPIPIYWFWEHEGKDIYKWIEEDNYRALIYSPVTKYLMPVLKTGYPIELWSCQPDKWKPYTDLWIWNNIPSYTLLYLNTKEKEKKLYREKDTYLVEDCPNFKDYSKILLIDTPYNQNVNALHRVKTPKDLTDVIERAKLCSKV